MLEVKGLTVAFPGKEPTIKGLSFSIEANEIFGLIGASGAGKSLTALAIMGLLPRATLTGQLFLNGVDLLSLDEESLRKKRGPEIAMVFQDSQASLNPLMPIGKQLMEGMRLQFALSKSEAASRALKLLHAVKMADPERVMSLYPHQLSGGMRQRVIIAIAIACNPLLLIADEATTALDWQTEEAILQLLRSCQRDFGMAMLFITHDLAAASTLCRRIAVMEAGGAIVETAAPAELFNAPAHPFTAHLVERARLSLQLQGASHG